MKDSLDKFRCRFPNLAAAVPKIAQDNPFFWEAMECLQSLEEAGAVDSTDEYVAVMEAIGTEAHRRAAKAAPVSSSAGGGTADPVETLVSAAEDVLVDVWDEIEQRRHSGNDENWRALDEKAGRLQRAVQQVRRGR